MEVKPLGGKAYGHIPHLPGSRMGPSDHHCHEGQARICTIKARDRHDTIIVQEKLDGSCVSVARISDEIVPLTRAGYRAETSAFEQHHMFADWAYLHKERFRAVLLDGERLCGEWLAQAHGTRYRLPHEPFVAFDLMVGTTRRPFESFLQLVRLGGFTTPALVHIGSPISVEEVLTSLNPSHHGAIDPIEGAVWRVERGGKVEFLVKYVRPDKEDGIYLPERSGQEAVWNWLPES